jgi:hypothetical protein
MKGCIFLNECVEEDKKNKTFVLVLSMTKLEEKSP